MLLKINFNKYQNVTVKNDKLINISFNHNIA